MLPGNHASFVHQFRFKNVSKEFPLKDGELEAELLVTGSAKLTPYMRSGHLLMHQEAQTDAEGGKNK